MSNRLAGPPHRIVATTVAALVLGAVLAGCGSSTSGLIPASNAEPLTRDFETVARAAEAGNGSCTATQAALLTTHADFFLLPPS
ncbi:MAG: hypothetical protein ACYDA6_04695, partial [Solirubrobacteraceae bacterium]